MPRAAPASSWKGVLRLRAEGRVGLAPVLGLKAVDLQCLPGGWTYQLVRRGMMVTAVDNGMMAQSLMDTGQVKHIRDDGFVWRPSKEEYLLAGVRHGGQTGAR